MRSRVNVVGHSPMRSSSLPQGLKHRKSNITANLLYKSVYEHAPDNIQTYNNLIYATHTQDIISNADTTVFKQAFS